jgi:PIN domain nuclease of toxin-antitoxin system
LPAFPGAFTNCLKVLVDTHVVIWWLEDASRLSKQALAILSNRDNAILISAAVGWEMAIKVSLGKLKPQSLLDRLARIVEQEEFSELPISLEAAVRAGLLAAHHRDPFDRLLIAQSQWLNVPILSADAVLDRYNVKRVW